MVDLEYLPALIPLIAVFYGLIVYTFKRLEKWCDEKDEYCALSTGFASTPDENQASTIGFSEYSIKSSYMCLFITGRAGQYVLLTTRLICFLYFFCIALTWHFILWPSGWHYFTNWNIMLISIYFLMASAFSVIGLTGSLSDATLSSPNMQTFIKGFHICFEVTGATALFVTVVNFVILSPVFSFWNVTMHFLTTCVFLVEMGLSCMVVRLKNYSYCCSWSMLYLVFIWIVVGSGVRKQWPYNFLNTGTWGCFIWYIALLLINFFFYNAWRWICQLKFSYYAKYNGQLAQQSSNDVAPIRATNASLPLLPILPAASVSQSQSQLPDSNVTLLP